MNLYEKIKAVVESGGIAITQNSQTNNYTLFSSITSDGWLRCSLSRLSIQACYNILGTAQIEEFYINNLENIGEKYIGIYEIPLRRPKIGDRVQTSTKIKKTPGYDSERDFMDYLALEVVEVNFDNCVIKYGKEKYPVPYDCLSPRIEPDE